MSSKQRKAQQPVMAHRLFPAIVGLWFAALFGLGAFAVPPAMLERLVDAIGLPAIVPAAAPPLGFTARALVALAMTGLGAITGFAMGKLLGRTKSAEPRRRTKPAARGAADTATTSFGRNDGATDDAPKVRARDAHPDAPPRRPLVLSDDLIDAVDLGGAEAPVRRRSLSMTDETGLGDVFELAPLPGGYQWAEPADGDFEVDAPASQVVSTMHAQAEEPTEAAWTYEDAVFEDVELEEHVGPIENAEVVGAQASASDEPAPAPTPPPACEVPPTFTSPVANVPLDDLGIVQLVERLALAIAMRSDRDDAIAQAVAPKPITTKPMTPEPMTPEPMTGEPFVAPAVAPAAAAAPSPVIPERVASIGHLAASFDAAGANEDDPDEDDPIIVPRFLGTPQHFATTRSATPSASAPTSGSIDDREDAPIARDVAAPEQAYSSLLDMPPVLPRAEQAAAFTDYIRIDEPEPEQDIAEPVVVFPGQGARNTAPFDRPSTATPLRRAALPPLSAINGPGGAAAAAAHFAPQSQPHAARPSEIPDADEADRALRAALATLQKMTGGR